MTLTLLVVLVFKPPSQRQPVRDKPMTGFLTFDFGTDDLATPSR